MKISLKNNNQAFTLIELLTTIAIIGLLATLALISVGVAKERAKISNAQHDLDQIYKAITLMQNDTGQWPGHQSMNKACSTLPVTCTATNELCGPDSDSLDCTHGLDDPFSGLIANDLTPYTNWAGPYMKQALIMDPWDKEYFFDTDYTVDSESKPIGCGGIGPRSVAVIGSYGPDGLGRPDEIVGNTAYGCDDVILIIGQ